MKTFFDVFGMFWLALCGVSWVIQYKLYKQLKCTITRNGFGSVNQKSRFCFSAIDNSSPISALNGTSYRICVYALKGDDELNKEPRSLYTLEIAPRGDNSPLNVLLPAHCGGHNFYSCFSHRLARMRA